MLQAAAAFGAGLVAQQGLQTSCAQAPSCSAHQEEEGTACKISVRVHTASVPSLGEPGRMVRPRLRLEAAFAGAWKETEDADFAGPHQQLQSDVASCVASRCSSRMSCSSSATLRRSGSAPGLRTAGCAKRSADVHNNTATVGDIAESCLWRFGDTLTFAVRPGDLLSGGMTLRLHVQSGMRLGPLHVEMPHSVQDLGEAVIDLRRRVLPACVPSWPPGWEPDCGLPGDRDDWRPGGAECELECPPAWETPALVVPLTRLDKSPLSGVAVSIVARVALSFSVNVDPMALLREIEDAEKPLKDKFADRLAACLLAPLTPLSVCGGLTVGAASKASSAWGLSADRQFTPRPHRRCKHADACEDDEPDAEAAPYAEAFAATDWAYRL